MTGQAREEEDTTRESVAEKKELGVIIDEMLKFDKHKGAQIICKANTLIGLLRRSFETVDRETLVWIFNAQVRPHLEHCNADTYPIYKHEEQWLDGVQRRATKMVREVKKDEYACHPTKATCSSFNCISSKEKGHY